MARLRAREDGSRPPLYRLGALLQAHTNDVRSLAAVNSPTSTHNRFISGSRDRTARLWEQREVSGGPSNGWKQVADWDDEGWVNAVSFLPARENEEDQGGHLVAAGADSLIHLYPLSHPSSAPSTPSYTLAGHAHNVCAIRCSREGRRIVSASWDMTARVWEWRNGLGEGMDEDSKGKWECERVLVGHGAAVWDVLLLEGKENAVLTACADGFVRIFDGVEVEFVLKGHEGPVRTLAKLLPEDASCALFASASNDGTIRIWNHETGEALTVLGNQDSFVYSLVCLPSTSGGGLASSGEDGIIKIWNEEDGEEDQQIVVPALSVWSLAALPNGDLACGCSDNLIWIFTRDASRIADEETTRDYETRLSKHKSSKQASSSPRTEGEEALNKPGSKEGEVKLLRIEEHVQAYQWNGASWTEVGEVVSAEVAAEADAPSASAAPSKMEHEGTLYDYVFAIDVKDDEPPLRLPYNLDDDPYTVATAFIQQHSLPESYLEQIVHFIRTSTA
ncbi:hypothetical protein JCM11641_000240 [Rhodosporidiobolus odoratus]